MKQGKHFYFAYGSNIDMDQMDRRCPDCNLIETAKLEGYRFDIDAVGFATIVRDESQVVYGVLWEISDNDLYRLDRYEGVATGCYQHESIDVELTNGDKQTALVYISNRQLWFFPFGPGSDYIDNIYRWGQIHGFPEEYLDVLDDWACR